MHDNKNIKFEIISMSGPRIDRVKINLIDSKSRHPMHDNKI